MKKLLPLVVLSILTLGIFTLSDVVAEEALPGGRCGGLTKLTCSSGSYCKYPEGVCDKGDKNGVCSITPEACIEIYMPVCGCDGKTYANSCKASAAGVSVSHKGGC